MPLPIVGNLRRAAWDRETVSIGGGDFGPEELKRAARMIENHDELLEALKLAQSIIGHPDDAHSKLIAAAIARATSKD
jgi:hypothetical protein